MGARQSRRAGAGRGCSGGGTTFPERKAPLGDAFCSLEELVSRLLDANREIFAVTLDPGPEIWKNTELLSLAEGYFDNILLGLQFSAAGQVRRSRLAVQAAFDEFLEDGAEGQSREIRTEGDPSFEEFFEIQMSMLGRMQKKLDRRMKIAEAARKVTGAIFATAFAALMICGVVAAALAAPPVAAAVGAAMSASLGSAGSWVNSLWEKYQEDLERKRVLISSMNLAVEDLERMCLLTENLRNGIDARRPFSWRFSKVAGRFVSPSREKKGGAPANEFLVLRPRRSRRWSSLHRTFSRRQTGLKTCRVIACPA